MKIVRIISEHKKSYGHNVYSLHSDGRVVGKLGPSRVSTYKPPAHGMKRVEAIINIFGVTCTKHIDVPRNFTL